MFAPSDPILVVDDMELIRQVVKTELVGMGFKNIIEAATGNEALTELIKTLSKNPVQLVISDWNMPGMTGLDFLKQVRSNPKTHNLPFIMLTTEAEMENVMDAIREGVSNYIVKPFEAGQLADKIKQVWKKHFG